MDQTVPVDAMSTVSLESLPDDVLIAIFSRLPSLADLSSVAQSSRSLHQCFHSHERAVLLGMLSHDFIPAIRDAVAAATTPRVASWRGREQRIQRAMQRYRDLQEQGPKSTTPELRLDEIVSALRLKTATCYLVDLFFQLRRHDLRRASPAAAGPLSIHERQRLSAAFLRHQLATTLHPYNASATGVLAPFFAAFAAWEAEQIHQAHLFVSQLCIAMDSLHANGPREPSGGPSERPYLRGHMYDLTSLYKAVKSAFDRDHGLVARVSEKMEERNLRSVRGAIGFLNASHDFPNERMGWRTYSDEAAAALEQARTLRSQLYVKERGMASLVAGPSAADPPFGWVDALDGLDCCRWGKDLPHSSPDGIDPDHYSKASMTFRRWKRLGLVFWDRTRVELIKAAHPEHARGWLLNMWNWSESSLNDKGG